MMASAEARVAWQRTANRCFAQEDAKRAPKLASCPSASSTSKPADAGSANTTDGHDNPNLGFMPHKWNHCYSNLPPESRWWLQLQPNYGYQRTSMHEQSLEAEMETSRNDISNPTCEVSETIAKDVPDGNMNVEPSFDTYYRTSAVCIKKDSGVEKQELKNLCSKSALEPLKFFNVEESCELLELDSLGCSVSKQAEFSFDSDSPWIGSGKTVPWWRVADRDELASLVAQGSVNLIENCDLPQPQKMHVKTDPYLHLGHFNRNGILPPSKDLKAQAGALSSPTVNIQGCPTLGSAYRKQWASSEEQINDDPTPKGVAEMHTSDSSPSKAELLEALRHSQTRAREAEKAAKQAHAEKEHILKLLFRQASHLFAYKQWFQLLQLENLYIQLKTNKQPISTLFPAVLPWTISKTNKLQKSWQKPVKGKRVRRGRARHDISKFTVAFALGFGLVGSGLLLGWTVGWMLPIF